MNLQENILRIREVMGLIKESTEPTKIYVDMGGVLFPSGYNDEIQPGTTERPKNIKGFQSWVINTKKDKQILGGYGADGKWGKNTSNAWVKYGEEYKNSFSNSTTQPTNQTNFIGRDLWSRISKFNPMILSAIGGGNNRENKIRNKSKQVTDILRLPINNAIFVNRGSDKANYAKGNILIDDSIDNINNWRNAGGIGILHKDTTTTLRELSKYFNI